MTEEDPWAVAELPAGIRHERYVKNGRYYVPDPDGVKKTDLICTRATTWARTVADTFKLDQWGLRKVLEGVALRPSFVAQVAITMDSGLDVKDYNQAMNGIAKDAKDVAAAREKAEQGTALHTFTEKHDKGLEPYVPEPWDRDVMAYHAVLEKLELEVIPEWIERIVFERKYSLVGTFDRILKMKTPCKRCRRWYRIGDLKTGRDLTYGWNEIAVQQSVYAHAELMLVYETNTWEPMPEVCQCFAYIIHLPVAQGIATVYTLDVEAGWVGSEICRMIRDWRKRRNLAEPAAIIQVTGSQDLGYEVEDKMLSWEEKIRLAPTVGHLSDIWRRARNLGEWTPELEKLGLERKAQLEG